jgi:DNA-binding NarL/FixJ family response regulator
MRKIIISDSQDITRAGLMYIIDHKIGAEFKCVEDKTEMIEALKAAPDSIVIIDYTLSELNDVTELYILSQRFPNADWLLFSEDLSTDFVKNVIVTSQQIGILLKESPLQEICDALLFTIQSKRYICQRMTEILLAPADEDAEHVNLTKTETEILKSIAMGLTTKEIAKERFSSFHTINTHRKNIFRKLGVNNVREATKYALRAGLIDAAEYYI